MARKRTPYGSGNYLHPRGLGSDFERAFRRMESDGTMPPQDRGWMRAARRQAQLRARRAALADDDSDT